MSVILKSTQSMSRELTVHSADPDGNVFLEITNSIRPAASTGISVKKDLLLAALGVEPPERPPLGGWTYVRVDEVKEILNKPNLTDSGKLAILRKFVDPDTFEFPTEFGAKIVGKWRDCNQSVEFVFVANRWLTKNSIAYRQEAILRDVTDLKVVI